MELKIKKVGRFLRIGQWEGGIDWTRRPATPATLRHLASLGLCGLHPKSQATPFHLLFLYTYPSPTLFAPLDSSLTVTTNTPSVDVNNDDGLLQGPLIPGSYALLHPPTSLQHSHPLRLFSFLGDSNMALHNHRYRRFAAHSRAVCL